MNEKSGKIKGEATVQIELQTSKLSLALERNDQI